MADTIRKLLTEEAVALSAEAALLREEAMRTPDPFEAISLSMTARRCEQKAKDLRARAKPH